jgi:hypothetical protein
MELFWCCSIEVCAKCLDKLQELVTLTREGKKNLVSLYVCKHLFPEVQPPYSPELNPLDFHLCRHLKTSMFNITLKWRDFFCACQTISNHLGTSEMLQQSSKPGDALSSHHVSSCDVTSADGIFNIEFWRRLTLLSTLLTSHDLTWSSGRLTCQHTSQISVVAHISWDVTYVSKCTD